MTDSRSDNNLLYIIQSYNQEHVGYLQRAILAESEARTLKDQIQQIQTNSSALIEQSSKEIENLNNEIDNLKSKIDELQNGSNSEE